MGNSRGRFGIINIILTAIAIGIMIVLFNIYKMNYFNGFEKAVAQDNAETKFSRDAKEKYSKNDSYKISNTEYNDSTFYKEIEVEPNTSYKITCMVKTKNVQRQSEDENSGAMIGLLDTTEYSKPIIGTNDWQKVEYMFNSRDRETVKISFRLGGNNGDCTGDVWFSDLVVEKGTKNNDATWKIGFFIMKEVDVNIDGKQYNLRVNLQDIDNAKLNIERYKEDCYNFSSKTMNIEYEIIEINDPVTTITKSDEYGYFFSYQDVQDLIYDEVKEKEFDHVFVICRMENDAGTISIPINDNWIGLGGMDMYGIGYSLIRINKNANKHTYKYGITNQAPEEVYLHEFLHTLERNNIENGYQTPALHDYAKYGYSEKNVDGLNSWYEDYMKKRILDSSTGEYIGLDKSVFMTQPVNSENFIYSVDIEFNNEPQNLFEEILTIFDVIKKDRKK